MFRAGAVVFLTTGCWSYLLYPENSLLQVTTGVSVPVELNSKMIKMVYSIGFQLNFVFPWNVTQFKPIKTVESREARDMTLQDTYNAIEDLLDENEWMGGRECLLRSICELAESTPAKNEDFFQNIIYLLLTPSEDIPETDNSTHKSVDKLYHEAELLGRSGGDCIVAYPDCAKSVLEFFAESVHGN